MRWRKCSTGSCATARTKRSKNGSRRSDTIPIGRSSARCSPIPLPSRRAHRKTRLGGSGTAARSETCREDYDRWYDRIVSYGELLSTVIVSEYLAAQGTPNRWLDMRGLFVTDSRYREATINVDRSARALRRAVDAAPERVLVENRDSSARRRRAARRRSAARDRTTRPPWPAICSMPGA